MSQVKKYKTEIVSIVNPVDNIYTLEIRSLSGKFKYLPGQFLHLALDEFDPSFGWPESRCFSMQSSPNSENIKITFSVKGVFTSRMAEEIVPGKIFDIKLSYGELFQQEHSRDNVLFIAGGTGITPFLSLFSNPSFAEYNNPKLYFGVRTKNYNIYQKELTLGQKLNPSFRIILKYQDVEGVLDIENIHHNNDPRSTYFISGPQAMISLFKSKLCVFGIKKSLIKTDEWE